jgi:hypothetical protein
MSWEAWAAIGQLIGAAGVIASLVFVGIQVRQSVRASKANAFQGLVSSIIAVNMAHMENPEILEVIDRAGKGEALAAPEHRLYVTLILSAARLAQSAHYQAQLGLLDKSKLESVVYNLVRHLKSDTGQAVWAELGQRSNAEFRDYIASLLERSDTYENLLKPHTRNLSDYDPAPSAT